MPNWNSILDEIREAGSTHDVVRRKYLRQLHEYTGRNTIIYYSGWLQKPDLKGVEVNDADKNGFMSVIHNMDRTKGLDLLLHTPGGNIAATESLVDYLRSMFGTDIRAVIPQLAMSAGTMIACAAKEIIMGKESSLGPVDPQIGGIPAHGVIEEFERAKADVKADAATVPIWQPIIAKYSPTFIGECEKAVIWADEMVKQLLKSGMFNGFKTAEAKATKVAKELGDHALTRNHARHLSMDRCKEIGLKIQPLEKDDDFQDLVLSVHHMCVHTLSATAAYKLIENHEGTAFVLQAKQFLVASQ